MKRKEVIMAITTTKEKEKKNISYGTNHTCNK